MGYQSLDDFISSVTVDGKFNRYDWNKITGAAAYTAGRWYDLSGLAGNPPANAYSGTALNAQIPSETSGYGMYHGGDVSTDTKHILNVAAMSSAATGVPSILMLVDLCLYYPGISMNSSTRQTLVNGSSLTRYTDGKGLRSWTVTTSTTGATAHNLDNGAGTGTEYVDQGGATSVHPGTISYTASAIVPHIGHSGTAANNWGPFLPLAAGDYGVRSYNYFKLSAASGSGTAALCIGKPLATIPLTTVSVMTERDLMNQLPSLPQVQDGACIVPLLYAGAAVAASTNFYGAVETGWS
ncbi:MAG: hypothetical protein U0R23_13150 [Candidatus Nanopelagicales bacterium]